MLEAAKSMNKLSHPDTRPGGENVKKTKHVMGFIQSVKDTFGT